MFINNDNNDVENGETHQEFKYSDDELNRLILQNKRLTYKLKDCITKIEEFQNESVCLRRELSNIIKDNDRLKDRNKVIEEESLQLKEISENYVK